MAKVMVVDDDPMIHSILKKMLADLDYVMEGEAFTGPDAIEMLDKIQPDIVLMDINMPGDFDGLRAGKLIQESRSIPVVYISADSPDIALKKVIQTGAYGFIIKPFDIHQLETILQIALSRGKAENRLKKIIKKNQDEFEKEIALRYFLNKVNRILDPFDNLKELLTFVCTTVRLDGSLFYSYNRTDDGRISFNKLVATGSKENEFKDSMPIRSFTEEQLQILRKPLIFRDFKFIKNNDVYQKIIRSIGVKAILLMPVFIDKNFYGVLGFYISRKRAFGMELRNFLKIIADSVSLVMKRHLDFLQIRRMEEEKKLQEKTMLRAEQLASLGQLTSAITHEIRQPLQSIKVLTDSVIFWDKENKKLKYEDMLENFNKISARVDRIDKIIRNMKLMAQAPEKIEIRSIDINRVIQDTVDIYRQKFIHNDISLVLELDEKIPEILFSDIQFQQILVNLISNSIEALKSAQTTDKTCLIRTGTENGQMFLTVEDNGPGVRDDIKNKIFDPFFTTNMGKEGMGMGLYIVRNILRFYNADIQVTDNPGGGAVFRIRFNSKG